MANGNVADDVGAALQRAAKSVRDPVPETLESDGSHDRHSGYGGLAHGDHNSRNPRKQGSGSTVEPMIPGNNSG
jgi:hypothetical protein